MRSLLTSVRHNVTAVQERLAPLLEGRPRLAYVGGHGVHNMRSRAQRLGGTLELRTAAAGGCCVVLRLPMTMPAAATA